MKKQYNVWMNKTGNGGKFTSNVQTVVSAENEFNAQIEAKNVIQIWKYAGSKKRNKEYNLQIFTD